MLSFIVFSIQNGVLEVFESVLLDLDFSCVFKIGHARS